MIRHHQAPFRGEPIAFFVVLGQQLTVGVNGPGLRFCESGDAAVALLVAHGPVGVPAALGQEERDELLGHLSKVELRLCVWVWVDR